MAHTILAFDPGHTTGVCIARVEYNRFEVINTLEIPWDHRFDVVKALVDSTFSLNTRVGPLSSVTVVVESFRLRQGRAYEQSGSDMPSSQVIGIISAFLFNQNALPRLVFQEPSSLGRVLVEQADAGWVIGSAHKLDAYRHARYYFSTELYQLKQPS